MLNWNFRVRLECESSHSEICGDIVQILAIRIPLASSPRHGLLYVNSELDESWFVACTTLRDILRRIWTRAPAFSTVRGYHLGELFPVPPHVLNPSSKSIMSDFGTLVAPIGPGFWFLMNYNISIWQIPMSMSNNLHQRRGEDECMGTFRGLKVSKRM